VLFHLDIVETPPPPSQQLETLENRLTDCHPTLRPAFVAYLERKAATCRPKTVSSLATRLAHFARFLVETDPDLGSLAGLDRRRHIEPYLNSVAAAVSTITGEPITVADQDRRIRAVGHMLAEITEWGWDDAPPRRLIFRSDHPRLPRPLPRYLPVDADRRLTDALARSEYRLAADALLLARAVGVRIGELLDLELDCVHEIPGHGSWLKIPLGKLDTERMVPLDDETVQLVDRIAATRTPGRPLTHSRTGRLTQFLFTHHGRRLSQSAVRKELARSAEAAGIGHVTPHQLRHTYATALVNAGVSLQALMALLGHVSAEMSLRYAHLFDATVRAEYERALDLAKTRIGPIPTPTGTTQIPVVAEDGCGTGCDQPDNEWRNAPFIKSRLAGGHCLRASAQGACPYANICEHCPSFRTDTASVAVLSAQRVDTEALAADAQARGWIDEADRHHKLLNRLDALIEQAAG
jgi:integrase